MEKNKVEQMSPLTWAYVGDSIYESYIRTYLVETTNLKPHKLHVAAIKFVKAKEIDPFARAFVERIFYTEDTFINKILHKAKNNVLNIKELSSLIHFPHGRFNQNPRLSWQKYKIVAAPDDLPSD